jgi:hypothetical protein
MACARGVTTLRAGLRPQQRIDEHLAAMGCQLGETIQRYGSRGQPKDGLAIVISRVRKVFHAVPGCIEAP